MQTPAKWTPGEAFTLFAVTLALLVIAAPPLSAYGLWGMALAQVALIGGPTVGYAFTGGRDGVARLGLKPPRGIHLLGAILIGLSFWLLLSIVLLPLVAPLIDGDETIRALEEQFIAGTTPLWVRLLVVATLPAICEELLFRGCLLRALAPRLGANGAIGVTALLFGAFHLSPARLLPTAALGVVLGYATTRTGSIWPAVAIHWLNNASALLVGVYQEELGAALTAMPLLTLGCAVAATAVGLHLISRSRTDRGAPQLDP